MKFPGKDFQKLGHKWDRQTDETKYSTTPHSWVIIMFINHTVEAREQNLHH